jgi:hypothetical protein
LINDLQKAAKIPTNIVINFGAFIKMWRGTRGMRGMRGKN